MTTFREAFPILYVGDVAIAAELYRATFGFEETFRHEDEAGVPDFVFLTLEPLGIGIGKRPDDDEGRDFALWIYTDDVDDAAERIRSAGATEVLPPTDQPWGERICSYVDPNGHLIHIGSRRE